MMTTHRIALKTHPLLTTHVRSVHSILFSSGLQTTKRPEGRHGELKAKGTRRANRAQAHAYSHVDSHR
jgi:hypothetical protein